MYDFPFWLMIGLLKRSVQKLVVEQKSSLLLLLVPSKGQNIRLLPFELAGFCRSFKCVKTYHALLEVTSVLSSCMNCKPKVNPSHPTLRCMLWLRIKIAGHAALFVKGIVNISMNCRVPISMGAVGALEPMVSKLEVLATTLLRQDFLLNTFKEENE